MANERQRSGVEQITPRSIDRAAFGLDSEPTCCDLACYEDEGCSCDGCRPDPKAPMDDLEDEIADLRARHAALVAAARDGLDHYNGEHIDGDRTCAYSDHMLALRAALDGEPDGNV